MPHEELLDDDESDLKNIPSNSANDTNNTLWRFKEIYLEISKKSQSTELVELTSDESSDNEVFYDIEIENEPLIAKTTENDHKLFENFKNDIDTLDKDLFIENRKLFENFYDAIIALKKELECEDTLSITMSVKNLNYEDDALIYEYEKDKKVSFKLFVLLLPEALVGDEEAYALITLRRSLNNNDTFASMTYQALTKEAFLYRPFNTPGRLDSSSLNLVRSIAANLSKTLAISTFTILFIISIALLFSPVGASAAAFWPLLVVTLGSAILLAITLIPIIKELYDSGLLTKLGEKIGWLAKMSLYAVMIGIAIAIFILLAIVVATIAIAISIPIIMGYLIYLAYQAVRNGLSNILGDKTTTLSPNNESSSIYERDTAKLLPDQFVKSDDSNPVQNTNVTRENTPKTEKPTIPTYSFGSLLSWSLFAVRPQEKNEQKQGDDNSLITTLKNTIYHLF